MKEVLKWIAFGSIMITYIWLIDEIGWWQALLVFIVSGLGWMVIYMFGLPDLLEQEPKDILPPDVKERLDGNSRN